MLKDALLQAGENLSKAEALIQSAQQVITAGSDAPISRATLAGILLGLDSHISIVREAAIQLASDTTVLPDAAFEAQP